MKILSNEQVRQADEYTINNEPIRSIDLMERAAKQLLHEFMLQFTVESPVEIFAGPGNNGGDGIALARLLAQKGYIVKLNILNTGRGLSPDAQANFGRLPQTSNLETVFINEDTGLTLPGPSTIIVDAIFGSGLDRPLEGLPARIVDHINSLPNTTIAVDIPSGLFAWANPDVESRHIVRASQTWCFQFPKLAFLMPENEPYAGKWKILDIGLHPEFINSLSTPYIYITSDMVNGMLHRRRQFSHKGDYGHSLLIAGSKGKLGAAVLAGRACLRSGAGLLTIHVPGMGMGVLQTALPEAMLSIDDEYDLISHLPETVNFSAVGMGPGIGTETRTIKALEKLLLSGKKMVLDADALNILSENPGMLEKLPPYTILTPHPGEYKRLFGPDTDHFTRLMRMKEIAGKMKLVIVLKGANTAVASPDGELWFNSTGNPGMATAGSGDVLTGIILSLTGQGYQPFHAAVIGVFIHGYAGDISEKRVGQEGLIAGDIIEALPEAFKRCKIQK